MADLPSRGIQGPPRRYERDEHRRHGAPRAAEAQEGRNRGRPRHSRRSRPARPCRSKALPCPRLRHRRSHVGSSLGRNSSRARPAAMIGRSSSPGLRIASRICRRWRRTSASMASAPLPGAWAGRHGRARAQWPSPAMVRPFWRPGGHARPADAPGRQRSTLACRGNRGAIRPVRCGSRKRSPCRSAGRRVSRGGGKVL